MKLKRLYLEKCTVGLLELLGFSCWSLELPNKGNQKNISCIPEGTYPYRKAYSPSKGVMVIWIDDVPNRSAIQIHIGNYTRQIEGCIAVGEGVRDIDNDGTPDVINSGQTMAKLMAAAPDIGFIEIYS